MQVGWILNSFTAATDTRRYFEIKWVIRSVFGENSEDTLAFVFVYLDFVSGVDEAMEIIEKSEREYPDSALFLFFKGRAFRLQVHVY